MRSLRPCQLVWIVAALHKVAASIGDRSEAYAVCVDGCLNDTCRNSSNLPLPLRLTFWTCKDDCRYQCQQGLTSISEAGVALPGLPPNQVVQFHGKWPFKRLLGLQEPFSVLFSLANLAAHAIYLPRLQQSLPARYPRSLRRILLLSPVAGINAWTWSSIFHTRDLPWTERMDYFSAAGSVLYSLFFAIIRLSDRHSASSSDARFRQAVAVAALAVLTAHISYLTFWRFDYTYNMAFNITVGLLHNFAWYGWSAYHYLISSSRAPRHAWQPLVLLTALSGLTALELFDFPPWKRLIDAHALWHLTTVPIVGLWYSFYLQDAEYLAAVSDRRALTTSTNVKVKQ